MAQYEFELAQPHARCEGGNFIIFTQKNAKIFLCVFLTQSSSKYPWISK